jgi:hypothetical protein
MGKLSVLFFVTLIKSETMALYGCFSNLISMRGEVLPAIGLGLGAGMGLLNIYRWCNSAQKVEQRVSSLRIICSY